ncbi:protein sidekick-2-like [Diachasmimorpha longicaudata]|uniref:protein sidekick-2-like n=1 Tax=Diachasmimorpha longicaudata TaxID=58733 RepID=UPI0030B8909F
MFYQCIVLVVLITVMEIETQCSPEGTCSCIDVETAVIMRNRCDCSRRCAVKTPELSTTPPPLQRKPPDAPIDLRVTDVTSTSVDLSFTPGFDGNSPIQCYTVQYTALGCIDFPTSVYKTRRFVLDHSNVIHLDGLEPNVEYIFQVFATNGIGSSDSSPSLREKTDDVPPQKSPHGISVDNSRRKKLLLGWQPPLVESCAGQPLGYNITWWKTWESVDEVGERQYAWIVGKNRTEFLIKRLSYATEYNIAVAACNDMGCGPFSVDVIATTKRRAKRKRCDTETCDSQQLTVTQRISTADCNLSSSDDSGAGTESKTDTPLQQLKRPKITTLNSEIVIHLGSPLKINCTLSDDDEGASLYWLQNNQTMNGTSLRVHFKEYTNHTHLVSELFIPNSLRDDAGTYRCIASTAYGQTDSMFNVKIQECPGVPTDFMATWATSTSIGLFWKQPFDGHSPITNYTIAHTAKECSVPGIWENFRTETKVVTIPNSNDSPMSYAIDNLQPNVNYDITIFATNSLGNSNVSYVMETTQDDRPNTPPHDVQVFVVGRGELHLKWQPPSRYSCVGKFLGYTATWFELSSSGTDHENSAKIERDATDFTLSQLKDDTRYNISLSVFNHVGHGPATSVIETTWRIERPGVPMNFMQTQSTSTSIEVAWKQPFDGHSPITYYTIVYTSKKCRVTGTWKDFRSQRKSVTIPNSNNSLMMYTIENLQSNVIYDLEIFATNSLGNSNVNYLEGTTQDDRPNTPPRNVQVSAVGRGQLRLEWQPPSKEACVGDFVAYTATWFELSSSVTDHGNSTKIGKDAMDFTLSKLKDDTRYNISLSVCNNIGDGPATSVIGTTWRIERPGVPMNFMQTQSTSTSIEVAWKQPFDGHSPITYYTIVYTSKKCRVTGTWKDFRSQRKSVTIPNSNNSLMMYTVENLQSNVIYDLEIFATNSLGNSNVNYLEGTTQDDRPNTPPRNVQVSAVGRGQLRLEWQPPSKEACVGDFVAYTATWFELSSSVTDHGNSTKIGKDAMDFTLSKLKDDTRYNISLSVCNNIGDGPATSVIGTTWRIDPPDAPTDLTITHITATAANLSFTPPLVGHIPIDNYTIQYVTSGCDTSRKTESKRKTFVLKNSNLIHLDELKPNAEYIFSIFATNSVGSSSFSRSVRKKTNAVAPEYPPRNISVESTVRGALYIRWEPPFPESCAGYHDGYNIMRSELSTSTSQVIQTKNITVEGKDTRYYTVSSLNDGTRYNISVAARNDIGIGPYSRGIIGTTQNGERPKITTPNSEIVIHLGSPLKINCTLNGDDEGATLYWLHNNQTMNGTSLRVQSKEYPNRTHLMSELSIPKSRRDHAGTYRCIASNAYGQSHSMFNVKIQERPGVPTNFMQTQSTSTSIEVSWKQPFDGHSPITSYTISYTSKKCSVSGTWKNFRSQKKSVIIPNSNDSLMIYTIKHLQSNVIYDLKIFATNSLGNSNVNHLEATTQDDRPNTPPRDVHVWAVGRGALRLKWQPPFKESCIGDFVAYNATWLELPYSESNYKNSARIENNATDFILSKLKDDTRYNISLSVFNNIGHGPPIFVIGNTSKPAQVPATSKVDSNNSSPPNQPDSHIPSHCEPKFTKPDPKPPFTKPLTNFPVGRVGGSVSADCIVDLTKIDICSIKEIAWYRWENHVRRQITEGYGNSGNRIELRYEVVDNTKYRRIVIANLALSDAGMYSCIVSTANNTYAVGNITLYVKDRQEHLYIYLNKADKGLTCGIHTGKSPGRKIDTIRWFTYNKYGASVNITTIADVRVKQVNEYQERLIINQFYHNDARQYCCLIIAQGEDQGIRNQVCEEVEATGPIQNRPNTRPAFIIAGNQPQPRKEGQSLELVCGVNLKMINVKRITGIQWYKWINSTSAYTQIENTPDCTAVDRLDLDPYREHKSTLIFRSLNILDSGHYKCDIMMHDHTDHSVGYDIKVEKGRSRYRQ